MQTIPGSRKEKIPYQQDLNFQQDKSEEHPEFCARMELGQLQIK
jgi:hypothetical protein